MQPQKRIQEDAFSVVLVEDHELTRRGIKTILADDQHVRLVGEAATAQDAISLV